MRKEVLVRPFSRPDDANISVPRPVLYVNTAGHLLGCRSTNAEAETVAVKEYKMFAGNAKQAVEIVLRAAEAANPDKKEVSALAQLIPSHPPVREGGRGGEA